MKTVALHERNQRIHQNLYYSQLIVKRQKKLLHAVMDIVITAVNSLWLVAGMLSVDHISPMLTFSQTVTRMTMQTYKLQFSKVWQKLGNCDTTANPCELGNVFILTLIQNVRIYSIHFWGSRG